MRFVAGFTGLMLFSACSPGEVTPSPFTQDEIGICIATTELRNGTGRQSDSSQPKPQDGVATCGCYDVFGNLAGGCVHHPITCGDIIETPTLLTESYPATLWGVPKVAKYGCGCADSDEQVLISAPHYAVVVTGEGTAQIFPTGGATTVKVNVAGVVYPGFLNPKENGYANTNVFVHSDELDLDLLLDMQNDNYAGEVPGGGCINVNSPC
jgi:hypothetical protein